MELEYQVPAVYGTGEAGLWRWVEGSLGVLCTGVHGDHLKGTECYLPPGSPLAP